MPDPTWVYGSCMTIPRVGREESKSLRLSNLPMDDRQPSAFSELVRLEKGAEGEAPVLDFEKVGAAPLIVHQVRSS